MISGGVMKRLFTAIALAALAAESASAADLATKAPDVVPVAYNWSGCYLGIEGGGNWGHTNQTAVTPLNPADNGLPITGNYNMNGGLLGGTLGCNYQVSNWVFGIENDFSWTNASGNVSDLPPFAARSNNPIREEWIDTLRGRIGIAWDRALLYGTGGAAFARADLTKCAAGVCFDQAQTPVGWAAGAGLEYAVWQNLSVKIEYLHIDLGTSRYFDPKIVIGAATIVTRDVRFTDDIVRAGLNWRFNWGGPVVARY
jgi:outer membrane immunogenic protein